MARILVVEDDRFSRLALQRTLSGLGHQVTEAEGGQPAFELAAADPPDVIVTDWMMPLGDGIELCRNVRAKLTGRYIYIIVLTGRTEKQDIVAALDAGADEFLHKPFDPIELRARIRAAERMIGLEAALATKVKDLEQTLGLLRENHERLVAAEKLAAVGSVALTIRHEVNNPLTGIIGTVDLCLSDGATLSQEIRGCLESIRALAKRIADTVAKIGSVQAVKTRDYLKGDRKMLDLGG
jgi:two-component system, NtrC family, sensor kinase